MAGIVKATIGMGLPGSSRMSLVPRACPVPAGSHRLFCAEVSLQSAWVNLCPFMYGARVHSGGAIADLRSADEIRDWLSMDGYTQREWECLCLRRESQGTEVGARLRD